MQQITVFSDTHSYHELITKDLPGGDILLCCGDISPNGSKKDIESFCKWFESIDSYEHKIFIAGNHDILFEELARAAMEIVSSFKNIYYLECDHISVGDEIDNMIKIYGFPYTPRFHDWAFNVNRGSIRMQELVDKIPTNLDILITHGPARGILDTTDFSSEQLGCDELTNRLSIIKPKIHLCGHIHTGNGYLFKDNTHHINCSVLNEQYKYVFKPKTFLWTQETNELKFIKT